MEIFILFFVVGFCGYLIGLSGRKTQYVNTGVTFDEHYRIVDAEKRKAFYEGKEYMKKFFRVEMLETPEVKAVSESDEPSPPLKIIKKIDF